MMRKRKRAMSSLSIDGVGLVGSAERIRGAGKASKQQEREKSSRREDLQRHDEIVWYKYTRKRGEYNDLCKNHDAKLVLL